MRYLVEYNLIKKRTRKSYFTASCVDSCEEVLETFVLNHICNLVYNEDYDFFTWERVKVDKIYELDNEARYKVKLLDEDFNQVTKEYEVLIALLSESDFMKLVENKKGRHFGLL